MIEKGSHEVRMYYDRGNWLKENPMVIVLFAVIALWITRSICRRGLRNVHFISGSHLQ